MICNINYTTCDRIKSACTYNILLKYNVIIYSHTDLQGATTHINLVLCKWIAHGWHTCKSVKRATTLHGIRLWLLGIRDPKSSHVLRYISWNMHTVRLCFVELWLFHQFMQAMIVSIICNCKGVRKLHRHVIMNNNKLFCRKEYYIIRKIQW